VTAEWTLEQAAELVLEQALYLLDGCDDADLVRPGIVLEALHKAWAPGVDVEWPELTAGEMRERIAVARLSLARGDRIP